MTQGHQSLSEKEKQTLRLLLAGHDAKSMARQLGLSVHTINERLRESRRKLGASSSREAARLLREAEANAPDFVGDRVLGEDRPGRPGDTAGTPIVAVPSRRRTVWLAGGIAMLSLAVAVFALSAPAPVAEAPPAPPAASLPEAEAPAVQAARHWLELGDAGDWKTSWATAAASFRNVNTLANWVSASERVRVPLGALVSRTLISADEVPTPPDGNFVVKFKTAFANRPQAVETLALKREDGGWKVVGIFLE